MRSAAWSEPVRGAVAGILSSVAEFSSALTDRHTYRPVQNPYAVFGFLWGLPIPFFSIGLHCWLAGIAPSFAFLLEHPIHVVFLAHPLLFAWVFSAMGTVRARKDRHIAMLVGELQHHVDELRKANEGLQELDRMKAQFIANVTHELKTPLVSIRGYNEAILEQRFGPLNDKQRDGLATAMRNIERLQRLIEEILDFERIESGMESLAWEEFDLVPLVHEAVRTLRPRFEKRRLEVELNLPEASPVRADREKILRVLLNLLSNAAKFSLDGGRLGVDVRLAEAGGQAYVTVWDRGAGIPAALQKHLFTRFWQAGDGLADKSEGTGLGLVITKGLLEAHGSTIELVSAEGAGTRVHFRLPLAARADLRQPVPATGGSRRTP